MAAKTICLNMIVKNESHVIERCLRSVKDLVDDWIIVDTGSTDGTQEIIRSLMGDIPGALYERPWVNFEHNRNEALLLARDRSDYILMIDADDYLNGKIDKSALCKSYYSIRMACGSKFHYRICLIDRDPLWRWEGVLHERISHPLCPEGAELQGVSMEYSREGARSRDPKRGLKDLEILEEAVRRDPENGHSIYCLANMYCEMGEFEAALRFYQKLLTVAAKVNEIFWSLFQIGKMRRLMGAPFLEVLEHFSEAYRFQPNRAEPLLAMIEIFMEQKNYLIGYLTSKFALKIPMPDSEQAGAVDPRIYECEIPMRFAICAYELGKMEEARFAIERLLQEQNLSIEKRLEIEDILIQMETR